MSSGRGILVIVNAAAGSAEPDRLQAALDVLEQRDGLTVDVVPTRDRAALDAALNDRNGRRLVIAGGDGSMHLAVARLRARGELSDVEIGLLPLGTGNDLARSLGIPLEPEAAAAVCADGRPRTLDLLVTDDGEVVVNGSHAGLGAAAAEQSARFKAQLGPLAYPLGALIAAVRERGYRLQVSVDDRVVHEGAALLAGVHNAPTIGGGTALAPDAVPDDGLLDVVVVTALGAAERLAFGAALQRAEHIGRPDVIHMRGRVAEIRGDRVHHDLDGEVSEETPARRYEVEPGAWRVLVPR